jgi:hypothetical protein
MTHLSNFHPQLFIMPFYNSFIYFSITNIYLTNLLPIYVFFIHKYSFDIFSTLLSIFLFWIFLCIHVWHIQLFFFTLNIFQSMPIVVTKSNFYTLNSTIAVNLFFTLHNALNSVLWLILISCIKFYYCSPFN